jgi:alkyl hydroperoxide reductase subunit AhpF
MKRHRKHKDRAQRAHFLTRCSQRIGYVPGKETVEDIVRQIRSGEAVHLYDQSLRVKIKGVLVNGDTMVVVYDKMRGTLVTVLPKSSEFYKELDKEYETREKIKNCL